jgi:hypothetical protein
VLSQLVALGRAAEVRDPVTVNSAEIIGFMSASSGAVGVAMS